MDRMYDEPQGEDWQRDDYEQTSHSKRLRAGASRIEQEMNERVAAIKERERVAARPVTVRHVDPAELQASPKPVPRLGSRYLEEVRALAARARRDPDDHVTVDRLARRLIAGP